MPKFQRPEPSPEAKVRAKQTRLFVFVYAFAIGGLGLGYFLGPYFDKPVIESMVFMNLLGIGAGFMLEEMLHPSG